MSVPNRAEHPNRKIEMDKHRAYVAVIKHTDAHHGGKVDPSCEKCTKLTANMK